MVYVIRVLGDSFLDATRRFHIATEGNQTFSQTITRFCSTRKVFGVTMHDDWFERGVLEEEI